MPEETHDLPEIHDASPKQLICRSYGTHIRYIRGVKASVKTANRYSSEDHPIFLKEEIDLIDIICSDAEQRAERYYREERQREAEASGGTSSEHRQYSGK